MDEVVELRGLQSSVGAPCPMVLSDEHTLYVAYYMQDEPDEFMLEAVGLVKFEGFHAFQFGPPNDEAFNGHPLYAKGLRPYGMFQINNSTWIKDLCQRNSVHPYHSDAVFSKLSHFVWSFHDTTLEVVAKGYVFTLTQGSPKSVLAKCLSEAS